MEPLRVCKTVHLPTPFVGLFLKQDLTNVEAWNHLHGTIVNGGLEVDFCPIIDWLYVALTLKTGDEKSPLDMPRSTVPTEDGDLLRHRNKMLTHHLPMLEPALQRAQG